jgi:GTP cyclohydrolase I
MKSSDYELIESVDNCSGSLTTNTPATLITNSRDELAKLYCDVIKEIGENPNRDGLIDTPNRAADAILYFTKGYHQNLNGWSILNVLFTKFYINQNVLL